MSTEASTQHTLPESTRILAVSGGVGGAKLAFGLAQVLAPEQLTIVANTADDFEHLGLHISPDIDTLIYTLSGRSNKAQGWGLVNESWSVLETLRELGGECWFQLGDRDLATHLFRTHLLKQGKTLSAVTRALCAALGVEHAIIPMSDDAVATKVKTPQGELSFQDYFVRHACKPVVEEIRFDGIDRAAPQGDWWSLLDGSELDAVIVCPSNPFVSVDPILGLTGVRESLKNTSATVIAVSPIIGGEAIKGPAARMMAQMGHDVSALGVAHYYRDWADTFVIDGLDATLAPQIESCGLEVAVVPTMMNTAADKIRLARSLLNLVCDS